MGTWLGYHLHSNGPRHGFFNGWDLLAVFVSLPGLKFLSLLGMKPFPDNGDLFLFSGLFVSAVLYAPLFYLFGRFLRWFHEG